MKGRVEGGGGGLRARAMLALPDFGPDHLAGPDTMPCSVWKERERGEGGRELGEGGGLGGGCCSHKSASECCVAAAA